MADDQVRLAPSRGLLSKLTFASKSLKKDKRRSAQRNPSVVARRPSHVSNVQRRNSRRVGRAPSKRTAATQNVDTVLRRTSVIQDRGVQRRSQGARTPSPSSGFPPSPTSLKSSSPGPAPSTLSPLPNMALSAASKRFSTIPSQPSAIKPNGQGFLRRLTAKFRGKKPLVPSETDPSIAVSASAPLLSSSKVDFRSRSPGPAVASSSSTPKAFPTTRAPVPSSRSPARDTPRARSKSPSPSNKSITRKDVDSQSKSDSVRGRKERRLSPGELSLRSFTFPPLPPSPIPPSPLSPTYPSNNTEVNGAEETKDSIEQSANDDGPALSSTTSTNTLPPILTAPSLVFSESDDSQPLISPTTPMTAGPLSDMPTAEISSSAAPKDDQPDDSILSIEVGLRQDFRASTPSVIVSPTEEDQAWKVPIPPSPEPPVQERSLDRVDEDEEEGAGSFFLAFDDKEDRLRPEEPPVRQRSAIDNSGGCLAVPGRPTPKRASTFDIIARAPSRLFGRKDKSPNRASTLRVSTIDPDKAAATRTMSILRTRGIDVSTLPQRAQVVKSVMTNAEIHSEMEDLFKKASLDVVNSPKPGDIMNAPHPVIIVDAETQRLTEAAYF